ncbi:MAG: PaaI family thioesterase [Dehalococcoidia bacterium]
MDESSKNKAQQPDGFTGPHQFRMEGWISCAPFERLLHLTIVEAEDGRATLTMPFLIDFAQGGGLLHGGALVSLADTAMVMAIKSLLPPQTHFATIALETKFLYPVKQGIVTAKARVENRNGRILEGKAVVYDETERPVIEYSATFKIAKDAKIRGISFEDGNG